MPKPPLGIIPRRLWETWTVNADPIQRDETRATELYETVFRYLESDYRPYETWNRELADIITRMTRSLA